MAGYCSGNQCRRGSYSYRLGILPTGEESALLSKPNRRNMRFVNCLCFFPTGSRSGYFNSDLDSANGSGIGCINTITKTERTFGLYIGNFGDAYRAADLLNLWMLPELGIR